jgi:[CysO sulfur-carrier protein]-S-L-cysteine hydrolase
MVRHAQEEAPNECVGLLIGFRGYLTDDLLRWEWEGGRAFDDSEWLVVEAFPLVNALADPRRFESDAFSLFAAERRRRHTGLDLLAIYHSHPTSPAIPSRVDTDPDVNFWLNCDVVSLIISLKPPGPEVRAYWLSSHAYEEARLVIEPASEF